MNPIKLYDGRSKTIKLFEDENIKPSAFPHNERSEPDEYDEVEEFEPKEYEESIRERTKLRREKRSNEKDIVNEFSNQIVEKDEIINKELFEEYFG